MVYAVIVADGDVPPRTALARMLAAPHDGLLVLAADGGALKAEALGLTPQVVVGDHDSLSQAEADRLRAKGAEVIVHPVAKDESDTELALREAIRRGATRVVILGAFGGRRIEHTLANVLLLAAPDLAGIDASLADAASTVRLLTGPGELVLSGEVGDYVSLLPLTETARGVKTEGLLYPLDGAALAQGPARGLSNELTAPSGSIQLAQGRLAVVHTPRSEVSR